MQMEMENENFDDNNLLLLLLLVVTVVVFVCLFNRFFPSLPFFHCLFPHHPTIVGEFWGLAAVGRLLSILQFFEFFHFSTVVCFRLPRFVLHNFSV
jgi:hypothetical protein